jgi:threonine synthase
MRSYEAHCISFNHRVAEPDRGVCEICGGAVGFAYSDAGDGWPSSVDPSMWRYWQWLPVESREQIITLGEGGTPLLPLRLTLGHDIFVKDETRNPTGSHKDRALSVAISRCLALGKRSSIVVSAGSTGLSHAAYCARAGITSLVAIAGSTDPRRVYPLIALGSRVIRIDADIDAIIKKVDEISRSRGLFHSTTSRRSNPFQTEAAKTIAYEIVSTLEKSPDVVVVPVGGGGTIAGLWRGFCELRDKRLIEHCPQLVGFVPERYDALAAAFKAGLASLEEFNALPYTAGAPTLMPKLAHAHPPDGLEALEAVRASGGRFCVVTDRDAEEGQTELAANFGHYVELSSGGALAAVRSVLEGLSRGRRATIVVLLCGAGLRETFVDYDRHPLSEERSTLPDLEASIFAVLARAKSDEGGQAG